jgi:hypothetical protein
MVLIDGKKKVAERAAGDTAGWKKASWRVSSG